jgi:hypothetical protein
MVLKVNFLGSSFILYFTTMPIDIGGKTRRKETTRTTRRRWVDNIKMDLRLGSMDWIQEKALVNTVMNLRVQ